MVTPQFFLTVDGGQGATTGRDAMKRRDLLALYGRLGLIMAAFALIAGVVRAPLLPWLWSPRAVVAHR